MVFQLIPFLIQISIGIGLSVVAAKIQQKQAQQAQQPALARVQDVPQPTLEESGGAIIDVEYGEAGPRRVAIGKCAVRGLAVYDNAFGEANKTFQRVLKLSDFYTTALTRVAIDGEWVTLGTLDATKGYPVTSGTYSGLIWVKFYDGRQTSADAYLTGNDNPDGRWTTNHIGIGISYAIVTFEYDDEKMTALPEVLFEFTGAPLYDPRLDSTVGGSGSHRFNNVSTWAYSANPILAEYNYRMGFYTGTYGSGHDVFLGMGLAQSELNYDRYKAAADICDETVSSESRYQVSIMLDGDRAHGDNIADLMQACAGMIVEDVDKIFPIINATQTPVATLTDNDLIDGYDVIFEPVFPMDQVVNTVFGTYIEPGLVYSSTAYAAQTTNAAVTFDRRTLDFQLNLPMVPSKRQAEQLASIYFSENRYETRKTVYVREKWQILELGDWITWDGDVDGADRDYQIVAKTVSGMSDDAPRLVKLTLQERHEDIYDAIGPVTPPTPAQRQGAPFYLQELQSFVVEGVYVTSDEGYRVPAIAASWAAVTDVTVDSILIEWRPNGDDTRRVQKILNRTATAAILEEGVVAATAYQVRNTIIPRPFRVTTPSAWSDVTTLAADGLSFDQLSQQIRDTLENYRSDIQRLQSDIGEAPIGLSETIIEAAENFLQRRTIKAQAEQLSATVTNETTARIEGDTAIAADLTAVEAKADQATASGLVKLEAVAAPSGVTARFGTFLRATNGNSYTSEAAEWLEIVSGQSRKVIAANKTVFSDTGGNIYALFDNTGAYLNNARITNLNSSNITVGGLSGDRLADGAITAAKILDGNVVGTKIADGVVTTTKLAAGAVTTTNLAAGAVEAKVANITTLTVTNFAINGLGARPNMP